MILVLVIGGRDYYITTLEGIFLREKPANWLITCITYHLLQEAERSIDWYWKQ